MANSNDRQVGGDHYQRGEYQHWDWCVSNDLGYLEGQITKYISRWRSKNGVQDLEKARHYAEKLYEVREADNCFTPPLGQPIGVDEMKETYNLTEAEARVFLYVCNYQDQETLHRIRVIIDHLIEVHARINNKKAPTV